MSSASHKVVNSSGRSPFLSSNMLVNLSTPGHFSYICIETCSVCPTFLPFLCEQIHILRLPISLWEGFPNVEETAQAAQGLQPAELQGPSLASATINVPTVSIRLPVSAVYALSSEPQHEWGRKISWYSVSPLLVKNLTSQKEAKSFCCQVENTPTARGPGKSNPHAPRSSCHITMKHWWRT